MINTNYNSTSKISFSARLNLHAAEGMISKDEIRSLEDIASKIGETTDAIKVNIGKTHRWSEGDNHAGDVLDGYEMNVTTCIDGDINDKDLSQSMSLSSTKGLKAPFDVLSSYFKKLEQITVPEFKQGVLSKIASLRADLETLVSRKDAIEPIFEAKKQAFDAIKNERDSILAQEVITKSAIETQEKLL